MFGMAEVQKVRAALSDAQRRAFHEASRPEIFCAPMNRKKLALPSALI